MKFKPPELSSVIQNSFFMILFPVLALMIGLGFHQAGFQSATIVITFLLSIILTSGICKGYAYGLIASVIELFLYNFFFCELYHQLFIGSASDVVVMVILGVALFIASIMTSRTKVAMEQAQEKEKIANTLFEFTSELSSITDINEAAQMTAETISRQFHVHAAYMIFTDEGEPASSFMVMDDDGRFLENFNVSNRSFKEYTEHSDAPYIMGNCYCEFPIRKTNADKTDFDFLGIVGILKKEALELNDEEMYTITTMVRALGLVIARELSATKQKQTEEERQRERYRSNLLRSISHDLRTPLAGIIGTSEIMISMTEDQYELNKMARNIHRESNWLYTLVQNILALTKLQEGAFQINKVIDVVEDVMNAAADTIEARKPDRRIIRTFPDDIVIAPMDSKLIQQAVINLLDNACKHTPPSRDIEMRLSVDKENSTCRIAVLDQGTGIPPEAQSKLFALFYTTHGNEKGSHSGVGLGLPIVDSILKAHGGSVEAGNRTDTKGAVFTLVLPMSSDEQISAPAEQAA